MQVDFIARSVIVNVVTKINATLGVFSCGRGAARQLKSNA